MKRFMYFLLNNLTVFGLCAVIVPANCSFLLGQIVQMGRLPISDTTSVCQSVYNSNTPQTPIRQIQYLCPTVSENEPVEPISLTTHQPSLASMTRHSNQVIPLPPSNDNASVTMVSAETLPAEMVPAARVAIEATQIPTTLPTTLSTTLPTASTPVTSTTEQNSIFGQYSLPQPLVSSPFLLASHPQKTTQTQQIQ
ncbi:MAG: hypothetical protein LBC20_08730, partial [Planctomycetaceae bacterium]|nr:hypothetical protein [Planctomycetaceae bacterium]